MEVLVVPLPPPLLPLLSARPVDVTERSAVTLRYEVDLGREVAAPPKYKLDGDVA